MRLPPPIAAGKCRVKEMALAIEWLPEEWPDGIPSLKQLLVVAPLTASILLPFRTEIATFAACGPMPVVQVSFGAFSRLVWKDGASPLSKKIMVVLRLHSILFPQWKTLPSL